MQVMLSKDTFVGGEETQNLKKCSRCGSKLPFSFFDKNRQGEYKKLCKNCSKKKVAGTWVDSLTDFGREHLAEIDEDTVIKCRNAFVRGWLQQGAKYVGKLNDTDVQFPKNSPDLQGDEILIEFHLFKDVCNIPVIARWRLRLADMF